MYTDIVVRVRKSDLIVKVWLKLIIKDAFRSITKDYGRSINVLATKKKYHFAVFLLLFFFCFFILECISNK